MLNIILNANTSKGKAAQKKIEELLRQRGEEFCFYPTSYAGHTKILAGQIAASGEKNIIAVGGDGTFHEVINGIKDLSSVNLGFIPLGSGNDFAKCAKLPKKLNAALDRILKRNIRKVDYISFSNGLRCLNVTGTGLDIEVLKKTLAMRRLKGKPKYLWALIRVLKNFEPYKIQVDKGDGNIQTYECIIVAVCNGTDFGGGMKISPCSDIADGKLNLVIVKMVERKKIKFLLPKFLNGRHINMYFTEHYEVEKVKVISDNVKVELDGEIYSHVPFECEVVKGGINMY